MPMFEKIVLRRSETGVSLTLGEIAEALLFYQKVHLILDRGSLLTLIQNLGSEELLALLARKRLTAVYAEDTFMCNQTLVGSIPHHKFLTATVAGPRKGDERKTQKGRLDYVFEQAGHFRGEAQRLADEFWKLVPVRRQSELDFVPGGILKSVRDDLNDSKYVTEAVRRFLQDQIGFESFAQNLKAEIFQSSTNTFVLNSNIDFAAGNACRISLAPELGELNEGGIFLTLFDVNLDINFASFYGGDFYTSSRNSQMAKIRFEQLMRRTGISAHQLQQFKEIVLADYPSIREVINNKERSFKEFELLLDQSERWRQTVNQMGPDANLVAEYLNQVTKEGWAARLPARILRFVIGLGIEGATSNPIASKAWTAIDTLLIEKLQGWRPNHFVEEELKPFLDQDR
jgi:hypothetical protein